jgi:hypothetical protein
MDPISALGLAAAACQFVDFGTKIIHTTYNIHQSADGATQENGDLAKLTTTLRDLQTRLAAPQTPSKSRGNDADQKALEGLAARCREIAVDLLKLLGDLKVKVRQGSASHCAELEARVPIFVEERADRKIREALARHHRTSQQSPPGHDSVSGAVHPVSSIADLYKLTFYK